MASATTDRNKSSDSCTQFDREHIMTELQEKGYCVIPGVLTPEECDAHTASYRDWLSKFGENNFPFQRHSIVQSYRIGHFQATWETRLAAKKVFETVWETDKLLTSFDGVAISPPPEGEERGDEGKEKEMDKRGGGGGGEGKVAGVEGVEGVRRERRGPGKGEPHWLHLDQSGSRKGLHCYQGAVYLEATSPSDYCFRVLEGSHVHTDQFYAENRGAFQHSQKSEHYRLKDPQVKWYVDRGCPLTWVPVSKGGMVLWDSRTVHDNCKPEPDRPNRGRWRSVVFVCMAPARWASLGDLNQKRQAYRKMLMTSHWPCQRVRFFSQDPDNELTSGVPLMSSLPPVARSPEVRLLAGVDAYDFHDGRSNGPDWDPEWLAA